MLPGQLSKKYLDAHFPVERRRLAEARISDMVEKIKTVFQARLLKTAWMDPETRRIQAEKIGSIVARVVEPLHGHWEEEQLDMDPLRYIKNLNAVQSLRVQRNFRVWSESRYGATCDSGCRDAITAFGNPLSIVNAWYNPDRNLITIPAGILQPPFYEDRYDNVSAYATIGMVIGHELSHAQDPQGSLFDKDGLLRDTWSPGARAAYEEKAQCLVREYDTDNGVDGVCSAFSGALSGEKGSYGMQTLCENTADQVGISLALDALALTYQTSGNQTNMVPDRDAEQFYLIFGQMWCSVYDQEAMCDRADDVHSLAHLRVRRTVAHQARFSEIHGCLIGQAMHRVERCAFF
jgi:putative endopeptidase